MIEILGATDAYLGAPLAGEMVGMRGGVVVVRGRAGERAGDRMRRGTIVIEGEAGAYAGSRMIAGTPYRWPEGWTASRLSHEARQHRSRRRLRRDVADIRGLRATRASALRLWAGIIYPHSKCAATLLRRPLQRLAGDMAVLGKGEIFIGSRN